MNSVNIIGRVGRDVELRYTPSNTAVADIGIAISEREKKGDGWVDSTVWVDVTIFGKQAETASKYLSKGSMVGIAGKLRLDQWDDKQTGAKRSKLKVICDRLTLCGGGGKRDETSQEEPASVDTYSQETGSDIPF